MSVIIFIIILAILILVHEFGHFIVAKKSGIRVDEFGLGFPPKLWAKKWGDTTYTLNALPFGGFVKIFGEDPHNETISEEDRPTSFYYKPKWIQALVLVAGVFMNMVFAWLVVSLGFFIGFPSPAEYSKFGTIRDAHLTITEVLPSSPAEKAGLKPGDVIDLVSAGSVILKGEKLTAENVQQLVNESKTKNIKITYSRGSVSPVDVLVEPNTDTVKDRRAIGIAMGQIGTLKLPVHLALLEGARTTWLLTKGTAIGLGTFLKNLVIFRSDFSQVSGPIGIATVVGEASHLGFAYLLSLVALISINLAIINLLPFPALDGGRLFFILIEAIIRRPISPKVVRGVNTAGFVFLIILMVIVTGHDILKLLL